MTDPTEEAIRRSVPDGTSAELDARVLAAARSALAERRQPRRFFGLGPALAIAATVLVGVGVTIAYRVATDDGPKSIGSVAVVEGITLHESAVLSAELRDEVTLQSGRVTARAVERPLTVRFPRGSARVERGETTVRVLRAGDPEMNGMTAKLGVSAAALVVAVVMVVRSGEAELEIDGVRERVAAPSERVVGFTGEEAGGEVLRAARRARPEGGADTRPGLVPPVAVSDDGSGAVRFQGVVTDAVTGRAISGAELLRVVGDAVRDGPFGRIRRLDPSGSWIDDVPEPVASDLPVGRADALAAWPVLARSDADGVFRLDAAPAPGARLVATAPGYVASRVVIGSETAVPLRVVLDPAREIFGRIVGKDGVALPEGAADVLLTARYAVPQRAGDWYVTPLEIDAELGFRLTVGAADELIIDGDSVRFGPIHEVRPLAPGRNEIEVAIAPADFVAGRITDATGAPIPRAPIRVMSRRLDGMVLSATLVSIVATDGDGRYRAQVFGDLIEIVALAPGYAISRLAGVHMGDQDADLTLVEEAPGSLSGQLQRADGTAIVGGRVSAVNEDESFISRTIRSDHAGRFAIEGLAAGRYRISYEPEDEGSSRDAARPVVSQRDVTVASGVETTDVVIVVAAGGRIEGQVQGPLRALGRVALVLPGESTARHETIGVAGLDDDGRFVFADVPAGSYAVVAGNQTTFELVEVAAGRTTSVVLGGRPGRLRGRVFRGDEPVPQASVVVGRLIGARIRAEEASADSAGRFEVTGLELERHIVRVADIRNASAFFAFVEVGEGGEEVRLSWPTDRIEGELLGNPLPAGVLIEVFLESVAGLTLVGVVPDAYRRVAGVTSADGRRFAVEGLAPGRYRITARRADVEVTGTVDVAGGTARAYLE